MLQKRCLKGFQFIIEFREMSFGKRGLLKVSLSPIVTMLIQGVRCPS